MDSQKWILKGGLFVVCNLLSCNFIICENFSAWLQIICFMSSMHITAYSDFSPDYASYGLFLLTWSVCYEIKTYILREDLHCILNIWMLSVNPCYLIIKNILNDLVQINDRYYIFYLLLPKNRALMHASGVQSRN